MISQDPGGRQKLLYDVAEACELTGLSRTQLYVQMAAGRLQWVKVGTRRKIKPADLQAFVDSLTAAACAAGMGDPRDREIAELRGELEQLRQHDKEITDLSIDQQVEIGRLYLALKRLVEDGGPDARRRATALLAERGA